MPNPSPMQGTVWGWWPFIFFFFFIIIIVIWPFFFGIWSAGK